MKSILPLRTAALKTLALVLVLFGAACAVDKGNAREELISNPTPVKNIAQDSLSAAFTAYTGAVPADRLYLQTDKPFYNPGETIWFQAFVRNERDLRASEQSDAVYIDLLNPRGNTVKTLKLFSKDGIAQGDIALEESAAGGIYKLRAYTLWQQNDADSLLYERDITVQRALLPRLKMKLEFERKAFGAGDEVIAKFDVSTLENQPLTFKDFRAVVTIAGQKFLEKTEKTDAAGRAYITFRLPQKLESSDGLLNLLLSHEGQQESISRSVPIVLGKISLALFPEGGDLIEGLESRVAFEAKNEFGKPADIEGVVRDVERKEVVRFSSFHQGMGAFTFTPERGEYRVEITKPEGVSQTFLLPKAKTNGITLSVDTTAPPGSRQIKTTVRSTAETEVSLVAQMRGKVYFTSTFPAKAGATRIGILTDSIPAGVLQLTLFDSKGVEQAERLVFTGSKKLMMVSIETNKEKYLPREKVEMKIKTTDADGKPLPAAFSLAVVDDKLLSFADDKQGHILSKLLLEPDLNSKVDEPNFYFDAKEEKAPRALDYLMMTRGWRRFVWKSWDKLATEQGKSFAALPHPPERSVIAGTVVDALTKKPVFNSTVYIKTNDKTTASSRVATDSAGKFSFRYVDLTSPVMLVMEKSGFYKRESEVKAYTETLKAEVWEKGKGALITGRVVDESSQPVAGATVQLSNQKFSAVTDREGKYVILGAPAASYTVTAKKDGYTNAQKNLKAATDAVAEADFSLQSELFGLGDVGFGGGMGIGRGMGAGGGGLRGAGIGIGAGRELGAGQGEMDAALAPPMPQAMQAAPADAINAKAMNAEAMPAPVAPARPIAQEIAAPPMPEPDAAKDDEQGFEKRERKEAPARRPQGAARKDVAPGNVMMRDEAASVDLGDDAKKRKMTFTRARVFAAPDYAKAQTPETRTDFRSTVFWQGNLTTNSSGECSVSFYNSDEVSAFRATAEGVSPNGQVGRTEKTYFTQLPFSMQVKVPVEVSMGDKVKLPLTVTNNTDKTITGNLTVKLPAGWAAINPAGSLQTLDAKSVKTLYLEYAIGEQTGNGVMEIAFQSQGMSDAFTQAVSIKEKGFPQAVSFGGVEAEQTHALALSEPIPGTMRVKLTVFPSAQSNLMKGIDGMLREPYGCFEQTSSSNYPNVIALRYLKETNTEDAAVTAKATRLLDAGYKKLTSFETKSKGYEWFGSSPPHEALTAYGILEFKDMQPVYASLDNAMVERTAKWLLTRKDGKGGFLRNPQALDSFGGASADITNAYIVYALCEAGTSDISTELDHAVDKAMSEKDAYQLALVANALLTRKDSRASLAVSTLAKLQQPNGSWTGKTHSITRSGGQSLTVETTALATLALMKAKTEFAAVGSAVQYLSTVRSGYGDFGSTQATVLALKALTEYAKLSKQTSVSGTIEVLVDGNVVATRSYAAGERGAIELDGLEKFITASAKRITVRTGKSVMPHTLLVAWNTAQPVSSDSCKVKIETRLSAATAKMGETVRLSATLTNLTKDGLPMTMAVLGIPAGLSPQPWQLKEMQERKVFDFYETNGREVICYYRQMMPDEKRDINLDLKADVPGNYESPASRAYLYYTKEHKSWSAPQPVSINEP